MATLKVTEYEFFGFNPSNFPARLKATSTTSTSKTLATLNPDGYPAVKYEVVGTGFKYKDGDLIAGTITKATGYLHNGVSWIKAIEFEGVTFDVAKALASTTYNPFASAALNYSASTLEADDYGWGVNIYGTTLADTIRGSKGADTLNGYAGNDTIYGGAGGDFLRGGGGKDKLYGDAGDDHLTGGTEAVAFYGGSGVDTVGYGGAPKGLVANLADSTKNAGMAKGDTYSSIENLTGANNDDKLTGNASANTLVGWGGNDTLDGGSGDDFLVGMNGADKLIGGSGSDTAGYSFVLPNISPTPSSDGKGVTANLTDPTKNTGDAKGDTYSSIENLSGTNVDDKLYGNSKANILSGLDGADLLTGFAGNDTLLGGAGDDKLNGGLGADKLTGGAGADRFIYSSTSDSTASSSGRDSIFGFSRAEGDKVDLRGIDANTKSSGDQAFTFIGTKAFSKKAGELRFDKQASDTYLHADVDGDGKVDFRIHFDDAISLVKADFLL